MAEPKPRVPYWHVYVDAAGVSRQTRCHLEDFDLSSIAPPATPQWQGRKTTAQATVMVTVLPVGWRGDWHENPKPQWIIPLSGRWYVETMDGARVEMGAGDISFGEDQGTRDKRGHASGTVGDAPAVLMLVQFEAGFGPASPCRFA
jgi:quercetin dioxygenase-like cupin family protein